MTVQSLEWLGWAASGVLIHWLLPARWRDTFLILLTLTFLYVYSPLSAILLTILTLCTYGLTRSRPVPGICVIALGAAIIGLLAVFKIPFPMTHGAQPLEAPLKLIIPLGLSYYTLRCLHYAIESYKGTLREHTFFDFLSYQFFFPTIIAGPIHRFPEYYRDRHRRRWDTRIFSQGLERILIGFTKIIVLGNYLISQLFAEQISPHLEINAQGLIGTPGDPALPLCIYLDLLRHGFNLYFQFSGYSDVAIGLGMLFGFKVMENFNWPFLKKNVSEFWQSWHISLTGWCREYIYMVVISNWRSPTLAAIATMLAIGFWHEMSFRYLVWGVYHGLGIAIWQRFQRIKPRLPAWTKKIPNCVTHVLSVLLTFHFIMFGFSIVQGPDLSATWQRWKILFASWWL